MKKQLIFVGLLAVGFASAQTDKAHLGKVGINIMTPQATIDIRPNADNSQETATTNEGILTPKLSKTRVANIEDALLVEGTLVYVTDEAASTIASYTGNNAKVAKITEKGYYYYNGTEWVKNGIGANDQEWVYNGTDAIYAKRAKETSSEDLVQVKNGKGLQQFIGSPDTSALTYMGYNPLSQQLENRTIFAQNAELKSVPNLTYITSDALAETSVFTETHRPNNRIFTSDYRLFQFKPSHLDRVSTGQATYVPYYRVAHFNNLNKNLFDIWLNRDQLYIGDNNSGAISHIGGHEITTIISGSNTIGETRGIDTSLELTGSNTISNISGIRNIIENTYGFTGQIKNLYGSRNIINFRNGGNVDEVLGAQVHIETPATSNTNMQNIYANVLGIKYESQSTTAVGNVIANRTDTKLNTAASTGVVQGINSSIQSLSEVTNSQVSAWLANTFANTKTNTQLGRMDGVVVSNNYIASAPVNRYTGITIHNKVSEAATGKIENLNGINISNEIISTSAEVKNNYGIYIGDINNGTERNFAIHTGVGAVRFGDLRGSGNRPVYADADGKLIIGDATNAATSFKWVEDATNTSVKLAVTSAGVERTDNPVSITDTGLVKATSFQGSNGVTIFPDYVFQKYYTGNSSIKADYTFKSLSQVEDFVKTNGHLPGYKSAEAIKAQGYVDLMETQLTNVEKIEELYLHSIEQEKNLKELRKENEELKTRLEKLEKLLK